MPSINIGSSGYITYTVSNNTCYQINDAYININNIFFDNLYSSFSTYIINWNANNNTINANQFRDNGKSIINLKSDIYSFTIESLVNDSFIGPFSIPITSPNEFLITNIESSKYSCLNNGNISITVSGGNPPYNFNIGNNFIIHSGINFTATGLFAGTYAINVYDSNNCLANNNIDANVELKNASLNISNISILPPEILDGYGQLDIAISGYGPYDFNFISYTNPNNNINFGSLDTTHLISYDKTIDTYQYKFQNILLPDLYSLTIKNPFGCFINRDIIIPNINPITVNINVIPNIINLSFTPKLLSPIFDTIFVPFNHIKNNTSLWQLIKKFIQQNKIDLKINNHLVSYKITKSFLYPYCIDNNQIEIVRLDNNENNWYFCFHVSPGINLIDNLNLIGSDIYFIDNESNEEFKCLFGLENDTISHNFPSLLIGSLTLLGSNQEYQNGDDFYVIIDDNIPLDTSKYDFFIKNTHPVTYLNSAIGQYLTSIYFLENFNTIIEKIDINKTSCNISNTDYQYIINIKKLLLAINNFNNYQNLYLINKTISEYIGSITIFIFGNDSIIQNENIINNIYSIDYFTFNQESNKLLSFYKNNNVIKNISLLNNIPDGYVIIRIKDLNNNKVKFINSNNNIINYDNHFAEAKNLLEKYNIKIKNLFMYGDILAYVPNNNTLNLDHGLIPTTNLPPTGTINIPSSNITYNTIYQSKDNTDTAKLKIETVPNNVVCYLLGPKNYKQKFIGQTIFENLIPGVYNIIGDDQYLLNNNLYNNNIRIIVLKNQEYNTSINFNSYLDKIFIKE